MVNCFALRITSSRRSRLDLNAIEADRGGRSEFESRPRYTRALSHAEIFFNEMKKMEPEPHVRPKLKRKPEQYQRGRPPALQVITEEQLSGGLLPLDYMLAVIRDPNASQLRRDKMAIAAAPYCHARKTDEAPMGKKDQRAEAAATAGGTGTEWSDDLEVNQVN